MIVASVRFEEDGAWQAEVQATDGSDLLEDVVGKCIELVRAVNALDQVAPTPTPADGGDDATT